MKRRGSITVFAALSIMLVAQLLFTLLEGARHIEFEKVLKMNSDAVLESAFAGYCSPLWETYHLLGMSAADSSGVFTLNNREAQLRNLTADNLGSRGSSSLFPGISILSAEMVDVKFEPYLIMTDQNGKVFEETVCAYMKNNLAYETAKTIYNSYEAADEAKKDYGDSDKSISDAMDALEEAAKEEDSNTSNSKKQLKGSGGNNSRETTDTSGEETENPLETVTDAKKTGVLSLVLPKSAKVSGNALDLSQSVSHRTLEAGTGAALSSADWYQKVLVNQYYVNYLNCYTNADGKRGLNYELEYLIAGKAKDSENLRVAVDELLLAREASNMVSLMASPSKQAEALALATTLAGASLNPVLVEIVKYGILASWAFAESVLDLRALLSGGKISLVKSELDWTSNVHDLPVLLSGWSVAKNCSAGLDYSQYLSILLLTHNGERLAMRAMDVEEATVCKSPGYENFRMDHVLCESGISATYEYSPVFLGFVSLLKNKNGCIRIQNTAVYSYREGKEGV